MKVEFFSSNSPSRESSHLTQLSVHEKFINWHDLLYLEYKEYLFAIINAESRRQH